MNTLKKHGFFWVMLLLFVGSLTAHFIFAWFAHESNEQDYFTTVMRDMFENWQSEMLQLMLQISLIAYLWFVGSPSSHSEEERMEAKMDWIMNQLNPQDAAEFKKWVEVKYPKK